MRNGPRAETWSQHPVTAMLEIKRLQEAGERAAAELIYAELAQITGHDMRGEIRARLRWERAMNLGALGRFVEAERQYAEAHRLFDAEPDSPEIWFLRVKMRAERAHILRGLGRYDDAATLLSEAIAVLDVSTDGRQSQGRCALQLNRALNLYELGRYEEAEAIYAEVQSVVDAMPVGQHVLDIRACVRMNRGINFERLERYHEAMQANLEAQQLYDAFPANDEVNANRARTRINRASILAELNESRAAEALFAEADRVFDAVPDTLETRPHRTNLHFNRGLNLMGMERHMEAEPKFAAAAALLDAQPDVEPVRRERMRLCSHRGENLHVLGRFAEAEEQFRHAQQIGDALPDSDRTREGRVEVRLARAANFDALGRSDVAARMFTEAEVIFSALHREDRSRLHDAFERWKVAHRAVFEQPPAASAEPSVALQPIELSADEIERARTAIAQMQRADELGSMGYYAEAETLYCESLLVADALPAALGVDQLQADLCMRRATNFARLGNVQRARELFADAERRYEGMPDSPTVCLNRSITLFNQGISASAAGDLANAEELLIKAQHVLETVEDCEPRRANLMRILTALASVQAERGNRLVAEELYAQAQSALMALPIASEVRGHHCILRVNRANNLRDIGRHEEALALLEEADHALDSMEPSAEVAAWRRGILNSRASLFALLGRDEEAEQVFARLQSAIDILPPSRETALEQALAGLNRAGNACQSGRNEDAEPLFESAQRILESLPSDQRVRRQHVKLINNRATNLRMLGRHRDAEQLFARLDTLEDPSGCFPEWPAVLVNRAENLLHLKLTEQALPCAKQALALADQAEETPAARLLRSHARRVAAGCLGEMSEWHAAEALYAEAETLCSGLPESVAVISERTELLEARATAFARRGERHRAMALFDAAEKAFATIPGSQMTRRRVARFGNNRANNLQGLGLCAEAEKVYADAQAYEDRAAPSLETQFRRAGVRVNRAGNLSQMGHSEPALKLHADAQKIYDAMPDSPRVRALRVSARTSRATALSQAGQIAEASRLYGEAREILDSSSGIEGAHLERASLSLEHGGMLSRTGDYVAAEELLAEAQRIYEAQAPSQHIGLQLACAQFNRATNFHNLGRDREAMELLESAQSLFDVQPDSTAARYRRAIARVERCALLCSVAPDHAWGMWRDARGILSTLRDASGAFHAHLAQRLGSCLFLAYRTGLLSGEECRHEADSLAAWLLDWADLADIGEVAEHAAGGLRFFFGEYLSWLVATEHLEHVPEVLSTMFGRYAAAERALQRDAGSADADGLQDLALVIRGLNSQIGRLEADPNLLRRSPQIDELIERLYVQREAACSEFRARRQVGQGTESLDARLGPMPFSRIAAALRARDRAALVILFRVQESDHDDEAQPNLSRSRAMSMVMRPGAARPAIVALPLTIMAAATPPYASVMPAGQGGYRGRLQRGSSAPAAGRVLREAVEEGWACILPELVGIDDIYVAMHHELGHLPWPAGLPAQKSARVRMHYGVTLAVQALEQEETVLPIAPPLPSGPIVVLAHSPSNEPKDEYPFGPIPAVYGDLAVTVRHWAHAHKVVRDTEGLLATPAELVQISSHGDEFSLHTGPEYRRLSAFELAYALDQVGTSAGPPMRALITVACSTSQAGTNILGESGGWPVMLHGRVRAVLGALYPVDDFFCMLWVLLLHRQWQRCGDLHAALARTREQMRTGAWAESDADGEALLAAWSEGLQVAAERTGAQGIPAHQVGFADPYALAAHYYGMRLRLYDDEPRFQSVTEAFVVFG